MTDINKLAIFLMALDHERTLRCDDTIGRLLEEFIITRELLNIEITTQLDTIDKEILKIRNEIHQA
jgi:hypothetical protein